MTLRVVREGLTVVYPAGAATAAASYPVGAGGR